VYIPTGNFHMNTLFFVHLLSILVSEMKRRWRKLDEQRKYIVQIRCQQCGESFVLKGRLRKGEIETGFKRCVCDNEEQFSILEEELV
jgi:hypothetical protein